MSQTKLIEPSTVHDYIMTHLDGVSPAETWGETAFFYNPGQILSRGTYFATIKPKDGANDNASHLDRPGLWRLNLGVSKGAYLELFGPPPERPGKGGIVAGDWDFTTPNLITPHPVYGWMSWIAVINPTGETWGKCCTLITDAHARAAKRFKQRVKQKA